MLDKDTRKVLEDAANGSFRKRNAKRVHPEVSRERARRSGEAARKTQAALKKIYADEYTYLHNLFMQQITERFGTLEDFAADLERERRERLVGNDDSQG